MENNNPNKGGFYMLTEELTPGFFNECEKLEKSAEDDFRDTYDFYPDSSV